MKRIGSIEPRTYVIFLTLLGFILRALVAITTDHVYYPDEIFQSLEQAHRLVFGYGIIPWEFQQGVRSWLLPGFLSLVLYLFKFLQIDQPQNYILAEKLVLCLCATSLIPASYVIAKGFATEKAGVLAAFFTCFWYELVYFAPRAFSEVVATYLFLGMLACGVGANSRAKTILFGVTGGLSVALRLQLLPVVALGLVIAAFQWRDKRIVQAGSFFLLVAFLAGLLDYWTWGVPFLSYYNFFNQVGIQGIASLYGTSSWDTYLKDLVLSSGGIFLLVLLFSLTQLKKTWLVLVCTATLLLVHSIIPHKEYRYIFTTIPLLLIALALLVYPHISSPRQMSIGAIVFLTLSGLGLFHQLPNQSLIYERPLLSSDSHLEAYLVLYEAKDLSGVYDNTSNDGATGGYYYLHRNVPVYFDDQLKALGISKSQLSHYVSHIIALDWQEAIPGFETIVQVGHHEIRRRVDPQ